MTHDAETVERVAKAIHDKNHNADLPWDCEYGGIKENCRDMARAALEAMEPRVKALNEVAIPALEFFADDENWRLNGKLDPNGPNFIGRIHARAALSALTKETTP